MSATAYCSALGIIAFSTEELLSDLAQWGHNFSMPFNGTNGLLDRWATSLNPHLSAIIFIRPAPGTMGTQVFSFANKGIEHPPAKLPTASNTRGHRFESSIVHKTSSFFHIFP